MKPHAALFLVVFGLVLVTGLARAAVNQPPDHGPVYTVAQLHAGLVDQPHAWVGRTMWVRGWAAACLAARGAPPLLSCGRWPAYLVDPNQPGAGGALPLAWGDPSELLTFLRGLPVVRGLVAAPAVPRWGETATYQVQLRAPAQGVCGAPPCYEALLLSAAPATLAER